MADILNQLKQKGRLFSWVDHVLPRSFKARVRTQVDYMQRPSNTKLVERQVSQVNDLLARMLYEQAMETPRFKDSLRLLGKGFKVYSQHDEDGIIEEIFRRIGTTDCFFVEFGVGDGLENCTLYLLLKQWQGVWIDGSAQCYERVQRNMADLIRDGKLKAMYSFITAENIEELFAQLGVPSEFDFLSIDIDNNDYWVWKAIRRHRPRVVAIEYNASYKMTAACVVPYEPRRIWDHTNYFGASLKALELLGNEQGYRLVGCNYTGVTAFFVRADLVGEQFAQPFTSENHYEPPRYFCRMPNGHPPGFGPLVSFHREPQRGD